MHHHEDTKLAKTKSFVVGKTGQWHGWLSFQEKRDARIDSRKFWKWWPWVLLMVWLTAVRESVSAPYLNRENSFGIAAVHLGTSALRITEDYHYTTLTHYIFSCRKLLSPKYSVRQGSTSMEHLLYARRSTTRYMWNQIEGLGKDPSWTMFSKNITFLKSINPVQVWTVYAVV